MIPRSTLAVVVVVALCAACMHRYKGLVTTIPSLGGSTHAYTLTNLHPDDDDMVLYTSHKASAEPFVANVERYFGPACPKEKLDALTPAERDAVHKEAVVLAIGYPPKRDKPSLDRPMWKYGYSRMRSFVVEFGADGKVATVYD